MRLTCFGTFSAREGEEALPFHSDKIRALLAYLALNANRPHRREALAALLWGELPESKAKTNLRLSLSRLRQSLERVKQPKEAPPLLEIDRQIVQLHLREADHWVDVLAFEALLATAVAYPQTDWWKYADCVAQLAEAVKLYPAEFLHGLNITDAPEFETWRQWQTEKYHQQVMAAYHALTEHHLALRQFQEAQRTARQQLRLEPWHEPAHRQLMRALTWSGQADAALRQYDLCQRTLLEELGAEPDEATAVLAQSIRDGRFHTLNTPGGNILPDVTPFYGRQEILTRLLPLLFDPQYRLISLIGPGGIGKSRLAREAARRVGHLFPDGIWFAGLAGLELPAGADAPAGIEALLVEAVGRTLQLTFHANTPPKNQLWQHIQDKTLLLILDNFEQFVAGSQFVRELIEHAPQIQLIVTSRLRLNLQAELPLTLPGLPAPPASSNPVGAERFAAVQLFAERARRADFAFALTAENIGPVIKICRRLEGVPLTLEIAATWIRQMPPAAIAATIITDLDRLALDMQDVPERHRSVHAVFAGSWRLLTSQEQRALVQVAVFRGGFDAQAAAAVLAEEVAVLAQLVEKSLLTRSGNGRYEMHELLRQFAQSLPEAAAFGLETARERHSAYYLHFIGRTEPQFYGLQMMVAQTAVQTELENVRAAWEHAVRLAQTELLAVALPGVRAYFRMSNLFEAGVQFLGTAVAQTTFPPGFHASILATKALFIEALRHYGEAADLARQALELAVTSQDATVEAQARNQLGSILGDGALDQAAAIQELNRAIELAQANGDRLLKAQALSRLARTLGVMDLEVAHQAVTEALTIFRAEGQTFGELQCLFTLTQLARGQGEFEQMLAYATRGLYLATERKDRYFEAAMKDVIAGGNSERGNYDRAIRYFKEALDIYEEIQLISSQNTSRLNLALVYWRVGHWAAVRPLTEEAIVSARASERQPLLCILLLNYTLLLMRLGELAAAAAAAEEALAIAQSRNLQELCGYAYTNLGHVFLEQGQYGAATAVYEQAITIRQALGQTFLLMETRAGLALAALAQANLAQAAAQVALILPGLTPESVAGTEEPMRIYLACYEVLAAVGNGRAAAVLSEAHQLLMERAAKIEDSDLREMFLEAIPVHHMLLTAYKKQ